MTVSISSSKNFASKLKSILDTAEIKNESAIIIMTDRKWHINVFNFMMNHKKVGKLKVAGNTYFVIKEMRIEIKPIDFYI
ncbi:hypothetical protein [Clostridium sp.]|jgi:hypothetical protein|uniref:hypothetical protein n=1 Tax=Clostridium sp. TaxID=1506 RepID=UPI003EEDECD0